jgi:hypothetical protein
MDAMIRIAISQAAFDAVAKTLPSTPFSSRFEGG